MKALNSDKNLHPERSLIDTSCYSASHNSTYGIYMEGSDRKGYVGVKAKGSRLRYSPSLSGIDSDRQKSLSTK